VLPATITVAPAQAKAAAIATAARAMDAAGSPPRSEPIVIANGAIANELLVA
jgi:hypothetical protein